MELNTVWIAGLAGLVCGILSGFGIGGGSLLMVWMTAAAALDQKTAQAINLLYFLPTSVGALIFHIKNKIAAIQCKGSVISVCTHIIKLQNSILITVNDKICFVEAEITLHLINALKRNVYRIISG